jgi:hypothetical protein
MKNRREFLLNVGTALGAAAVLGSTSPTASATTAKDCGQGQAVTCSPDNMERWLLSTGQGKVDPALLEMMSRSFGA